MQNVVDRGYVNLLCVVPMLMPKYIAIVLP